MEPEVIDHVFEPFFTTKEVGKGSGLGLSQVYGFVNQSDGHILIDSTPGVGTAVTLYLPRTESADAPAAADARSGAAPGGNETLLIVDDNMEVREVMAVIVGSLGYQVLTAGDAAEALEQIRSQRNIDLLVSDIVMSGGVNGYELAERARAASGPAGPADVGIPGRQCREVQLPDIAQALPSRTISGARPRRARRPGSACLG